MVSTVRLDEKGHGGCVNSKGDPFSLLGTERARLHHYYELMSGKPRTYIVIYAYVHKP